MFLSLASKSSERTEVSYYR